jgi:branched-chain amino acid transport system permease protein
MDTLRYLYLPLAMLGINAILAVSLQLIIGGAGILSLGHATFFAIGAYSYGVYGLLSHSIAFLPIPFHLLLGIIFSCGIAGIFGFLIALPCLRLHGDYLAMATLGFGQILSTIFKNISYVGGASGFKISSEHILLSQGPLLIVIWITFLFVLMFISRLYETGMGYAIFAIRDSEIAARCLGVNSKRISLWTFVIGSTFSGLAGVFYAQVMQFVSPIDATFVKSVEIVLAVVIGGLYSVKGALIGVFLLLAPLEALRFVETAWIKDNRMLIYGLLVIVFILIMPNGLYDFYQTRVKPFWKQKFFEKAS